MVTQDGSMITFPPTESLLSSAEAHSVTMVSEDGTEGQVCDILECCKSENQVLSCVVFISSKHIKGFFLIITRLFSAHC